MEQSHSGSGDNVGRDKIVNVLFSQKVILLAASSLIIGGFLLVWFGDYLESTYTLTGVVENHEGAPTSGTQVQLTIDDNEVQKVVSDEKGSFILELENIPSSVKADVFFKNKLQFSKKYNEEFLEKNSISIKLPRVDSPFRVTYWILDESHFKFIAKNSMHEIGPAFQNSILLKNDILDDVNLFYANYSTNPFGGVSILASNSSEVDGMISEKRHSNILNGLFLFPNVIDLPKISPSEAKHFENNTYGIYNFEEDIARHWDMADEYYELGAINSEFFWSDARQEDFLPKSLGTDWWPEELYPFVKKLSQKEVPKYFAIKLLKNIRTQCMPDIFDLKGELVIPDVSLMILQIENIREEPLHLQEFSLKSNDYAGLRYYAEDSLTLQKIKPNTKKYNLPRPLLQNEKLIIPLHLYFDHSPFFHGGGTTLEQTEFRNSPELPYNYSPTVESRIRSLLDKGKDKTFANKFLNEHVDLIDFNKLLPSKDSLRFVFGTSLQLDSLQANNAVFPVRKFDPNNVWAENGVIGGASCPFVYTFDNSLGEWVDEGVIIPNFNAKEKEDWDVKIIKQFTGELIIKEKEPETSYLNSLYIELIGKNDQNEILLPLNELLNKVDLQYLILEENQEINISFETRKKTFDIHKIALHNNGYFIPYEYGKKNALPKE